jgi:hypothetical protein
MTHYPTFRFDSRLHFASSDLTPLGSSKNVVMNETNSDFLTAEDVLVSAYRMASPDPRAGDKHKDTNVVLKKNWPCSRAPRDGASLF